MNSSLLFTVLLCLTFFSYWFGIQRSIKVAGGTGHKKDLTCLPEQFGLLTALVCGLPALITLLIFNSVEQFIIEQLLTTTLSSTIQTLSTIDLGLYLNNIYSLASSDTTQQLLISINNSNDSALQEQLKAASILVFLPPVTLVNRNLLVLKGR